MLKVELHNHGTDGDTVPCFATCTEIEIAAQLRRELETLLLAPSTPPPLPATSSAIPEATLGPGNTHEREQP
jgi:hypothetical protein